MTSNGCQDGDLRVTTGVICCFTGNKAGTLKIIPVGDMIVIVNTEFYEVSCLTRYGVVDIDDHFIVDYTKAPGE